MPVSSSTVFHNPIGDSVADDAAGDAVELCAWAHIPVAAKKIAISALFMGVSAQCCLGVHENFGTRAGAQ